MTQPIIGSTIGLVWGTLIGQLRARPGLEGVPVEDHKPRKGTDVRTDAGALEAIWLGDADGRDTVTNLKALPLWFDGNYEFDVLVQVLLEASDATQTEAIARAAELLGEVLDTLAADPTLGIAFGDDTTQVRRCEVIPAGYRLVTGGLQNKPGYGARYELRLEVRDRLAFEHEE